MMSGNRRPVQQELTAGFPLLSQIELHDCLLALGISVSTDDISKPSIQTTQMIYAQLVEILMGAPMDGMEGPKTTLLGMMEYKVRIDTHHLCPHGARGADGATRICMGTLCISQCSTDIGMYSPVTQCSV